MYVMYVCNVCMYVCACVRVSLSLPLSLWVCYTCVYVYNDSHDNASAIPPPPAKKRQPILNGTPKGAQIHLL